MSIVCQMKIRIDAELRIREKMKKELSVKILKGLSVTISGVLLVACAGNVPKLPTETLSASKDIPLPGENHVALQVVSVINSADKNSQNVLNVVARSDTASVAGLQVLQVGLMLLGGGSTAINSFSKDQLKGSNIESVANPGATNLEPGLVKLLNSVALKPDVAGKVVKVKPGKFKLIYDGLNEENYGFVYDTTIIFSTDVHTGSYSYNCSSASMTSGDTHKTYEQWSSNNYAEVLKVSQKLAEQCLSELSRQTNKDNIVRALNGELSSPVS